MGAFAIKVDAPPIIALARTGESVAATRREARGIIIYQRHLRVTLLIRHPEVPERIEGLERRRPPSHCESRAVHPSRLAALAPQDDGQRLVPLVL